MCSSDLKKLIPKLTQAVTTHLNDLGFAQSQLDVALTTTAVAAEAKATGLDPVEFQFAPNPGDPARPLRAIAPSRPPAPSPLPLAAPAFFRSSASLRFVSASSWSLRFASASSRSFRFSLQSRPLLAADKATLRPAPLIIPWAEVTVGSSVCGRWTP